MAGASDKARFYLEQSVPELHDLLRKKLFTEVRGLSVSVMMPFVLTRF